MCKKLFGALQSGASRRHACKHAGIGYSTLCHWLAAGRRASTGRFRTFRLDLKAAEANIIFRNLTVIQTVARGGQPLKRHRQQTRTIKDAKGVVRGTIEIVETITTDAPPCWQAAAHWLAVAYPEEYGPQRDLIRQLAKEQKETAKLVRALASRQTPPAPP